MDWGHAHSDDETALLWAGSPLALSFAGFWFTPIVHLELKCVITERLGQHVSHHDS
jgi:hypothetical protein